MTISIRISATILLLFTAMLLPAQDVFNPSFERLTTEATQVDDVISIDGILNEPEWTTADSMTNFIQVEPYQGTSAQNKTVVKVLYSEAFLYVGVACYDSLGKQALRIPDMMRDFEWRAHDTFAMCIDGFNDKRNSVSFATNPLGAQKDYLSFDDVLFDSDWNGLWTVRTTITNQGWFAEFRIPFKTLRYPKMETIDYRSWGINFLRLRRASNEISTWSSYPRSFGFNRMEYSGEIKKIVAPPPSPDVQVNPYSLVSVNKHVNSDHTTSTNYRYKIGGELKWAINSNTIADLTIHTDFAQADADVQVNNVSRFSILFPEKRQFFLENASLLGPGLIAGSTGGNMQLLPFFSRRIGLSENGVPLPIQAGVRLAHRSLRQNFGIMTLRQGQDLSVPSANFAVGRYSRNFGKQNRLGVIGTLKSTNDHTNSVGGVDGLIRFTTSQSLNFMALQSFNTNQAGTGFGGYAQYYFINNKVTAWITQSVLTKDFNPELGFISRTDVVGTTPGAIANFRGKYLPLKKFVRAFKPALMTSWYHQASTGILTEREIRVSPFRFEMQDGGYYEFAVSNNYQNLLQEFNPLGVTIGQGEYHYNRYSLLSGSDASRKFSYTGKYEFGDYYNGQLRTVTFAVSIIPLPHISVKASVNGNQLKGVGEDFRSENILLYTVQGRLALNPRLQLTGLYQRNSNTRLDYYNVRLAWEYKPLSYVYVVVNSKEIIETDASQQREQQGIFKVSYLKQF